MDKLIQIFDSYTDFSNDKNATLYYVAVDGKKHSAYKTSFHDYGRGKHIKNGTFVGQGDSLENVLALIKNDYGPNYTATVSDAN